MSKSLLRSSIITGIVVIIAIVIYGFIPAVGPVRQVTIDQGMGRKAIAKRLRDEGLIRSWVHFWAASLIYSKPLQYGTYSINPRHNAWEILQTFETGKERTVILRIPEGWRREQIARALAELRFDSTQFLALTKDKEGYLFPDTYFVETDASIASIIEKLTSNFERRVQQLQPTREQLILASIVEREAKTDTERSLIAGIYSNRLKIGMKLDADPTVQYGKETNLLDQGKTVDTFWRSITVSDYSGVISPYNTYLNPGLPPGPIANPGAKSIEAAINPASTNAYYFFHTADGEIVTSRTMDEHNANKRKYLR